MPPKKVPASGQQPRSSQPGPAPAANGSRANGSRRRRQRRRRAVGTVAKAEAFTPWFPWTEFTITSTSHIGLLAAKALHPKQFPSTPYYAAVANYAFRREAVWEVKVVITAASFTGARLAVVIDPDMSLDPRTADPLTVLGWVQNGLGVMVTATGTGVMVGRLQHTHQFSQLSNSTPVGVNLLGFSVGTAQVHLMDAPIGLSTEVTLRAQVLLRVQVSGIVPANGFVDLEPPWNPGPSPGPSPEPLATLEVDFSKETGGNKDKVPQVWHTGDIFLAPGEYWLVADSHQGRWVPRPSLQGREIPPWTVWSANPVAKEWVNDDGQKANPVYFTCYQSDAGGWRGMVGFTTIGSAILCATAPASVAEGAAYAISAGDAEKLDSEVFNTTDHKLVLRKEWPVGFRVVPYVTGLR